MNGVSINAEERWKLGHRDRERNRREGQGRSFLLEKFTEGDIDKVETIILCAARTPRPYFYRAPCPHIFRDRRQYRTLHKGRSEEVYANVGENGNSDGRCGDNCQEYTGGHRAKFLVQANTIWAHSHFCTSTPCPQIPRATADSAEIFEVNIGRRKYIAVAEPQRSPLPSYVPAPEYQYAHAKVEVSALEIYDMVRILVGGAARRT